MGGSTACDTAFAQSKGELSIWKWIACICVVFKSATRKLGCEWRGGLEAMQGGLGYTLGSEPQEGATGAG